MKLRSAVILAITRERYVNRIFRKVMAMERLAEGCGVQLKASDPSTTITN
jgi:hypothetical protein